ncbi:amino acid permease [Priestia aryabhattai]|uniref:amino acid permease n=1 Tax=Bacillaceae TaxID=186817 RepID=UPI000BA0A0C0|nr:MULTISPECIES: amino acid permease [Bacillaceae]MDT2047195.1 amino acid permease [Priestia flexa]OZT14234.1 amino acid permease [Priestia aryabhattai]TDB54952.1 amino acid permease [Bacillus sp. CBEL-1]USY56687.1 amino acid permease [Bacillus sp. 1780r2a1]
MAQHEGQNDLKRTMKSRHLFMVSLGGVIGTGLFLSSGYTIGQAGPGGAMLAYLVGGFIMYLVMLCLGELSVAMPHAGSFQVYATKFIGPGTGFAVGWLYWLTWVVTVGSEFIAVGLLMQRWFPDSPVWIWSVLFAITIFVCNAMSVRFFAESEFWFSLIKVVAIIVFIIVGGMAIFGFISIEGQSAPLFSNFTGEGGMFPNGFTPVLATMVAVSFAFSGTELIGIAAGESENPERDVPKSIRNIVWRTFFFFIGAIFVLSALIPWKEAGVTESPFVTVFARIGIPYAADIMNFVILTALLSIANSGLYACARMLWSLSKQNMISPALGKVTSKGVPLNALIVSMAVACLSLLTSVFAADTVYMVLVGISGFAVVAVWMSIAASQYMFRRKYIKEGNDVGKLVYKAPLYPIVPILAFLLCLASCVGLAFDPSQRIALYCGIPFVLLCYAVYYWRRRKGLKVFTDQSEAK